MKKLIQILVLQTFLLLVLSGLSSAQFLGQLNTAKTFQPGEFNLGGYLGVYENAISTFGQFRMGVIDYFDFGVKLGVLDFQTTGEKDHTGVILGGDLKYGVLDTEIDDPFDLSLGMVWEYSDVDYLKRFAMGGNLVLSRDFILETGNTISPYGRMNVRWEKETKEIITPKYPLGKEESETHLRPGVTLGALLQARGGWYFVGEFQLDEYYGVLMGLSYYIY